MRPALLISFLLPLASAASPTEPVSTFQGLGDLPGGSFESVALSLSPDGRVVTGWSRTDVGYVPFRWENGVMTAPTDQTSLFGLRRETPDGRFRVGSAETPSGHEAILWRNGQAKALGGLSFDHELFSRALGVSADGGIVVGASDVEGRGSAAFLWAEAHGMRALADVLVADHGLDLTGWTLAEATAISDDGRTVVGFGQNRDGHTEGWIARLAGPAATPKLPAHVFGRYERTLGGFREPAGGAITADGRIYVVDRALDRVVEHSADGRVLRVVSRAAGFPNQLRQPSAVSVAPDGRVVVLDTGNDRVVLYNRDGMPRRAFGRFGHHPGELNRPLGLAVSGARIAVADTGNDRVQVFDWDGRLRLELVGRERSWRPTALAFDGEGGLWVADGDSGVVSRFGGAGKKVSSFGLPEPAAALAWKGEVLLALATDSSRVEGVDATGAPLGSWGRPALRPREGEGRLHRPESLVLSPSGEQALLCEPGEGRCQLFSRGPEPPSHRPTHPPAHFGGVMAVAGRILAVARPWLGVVDLFDLESPAEPRHLARAGELGRRFGQLRQISGLSLDLERGRLWVSDGANRRVSEFELPPEVAAPQSLSVGRLPRARFLRALDASAEAMRPGALAVTGSGTVVAVDETRRTVRRFDGGDWKRLAPTVAEASFSPLALAIDEAAAELVVLTSFPPRVHRFDLEGRPRSVFDVPPARALALGTGGRLWLATEEGPLLELDASGRVLSRLGRPDHSPAEPLGAGLRRVQSLGIDGRGQILALDVANHRVVTFATSGEVVGAFGSGLFARPARLEARPSAPLPPVAIAPPPGWPPARPSFSVELSPSPEAIPAFEPFSLEVRVVLREGDPGSEGVELAVDATMPAHRHGMTTQPAVTPLGQGRFRVEGLLLHMPGEWVLFLDVTRRGITERVEVPVRLE